MTTYIDKNRIDLYVTDKRHQTLLFVIDEVLHASAGHHLAWRVHVESALVMLWPEFPEPDISAVHYLPLQRLMGNIVLRLPATFVAHSWLQAQIIVVETCTNKPNRIESYFLQSNRSMALNNFNGSYFFAPRNFSRLQSR